MELLARLRGRAVPDVIIECRRCGTTVDRATATCPGCEADDFARYEIAG